MHIKKYTYVAFDWNGNPVELTVIAESNIRASATASGILEGAREFIDIDEGIFLNNEENYK